MTKFSLFLTLFLGLLIYSCKAQTLDKYDLNNYKNEILPENEMRKTTDKAVKLIQESNYKEFKNLIAEDVSKNLTEQQIIKIVDHINLLFKVEAVPTGDENIIPTLSVSINGPDTLFINNILYNFKPVSNAPNSTIIVLSFSFLKKYGTQKLAGVNLKNDTLSSGNTKPASFEKIKLDTTIYLLDNKVKILSSKVVSEMSNGIWALKYHNSPKPILALSDENAEVNLFADLNQQTAKESQIASYKNFRIANLKQTRPDAKILNEGVKIVNGKNIGFIKFSSQSDDQKFFNFFFFTVVDGRILEFTFNCTDKLQTTWEKSADEILNSIKIR